MTPTRQARLCQSNPEKSRRKREVPESLDRVVLWANLVELITPSAPEAGCHCQIVSGSIGSR